MIVKKLIVFVLAFVWIIPVKAQYDWDAKEKDRMSKAKVKTQTQWTHDYTNNNKPSAKGYKSAVTNYNKYGDVTEVINYNEEGKILSTILYQYDSKGNKTSFERYQGNKEKLQYSQKTVYDISGKRIKEHGFDGNSMYNNTYSYSAGKLSEIIYHVDNKLVEKRILKYTGNKTEIQIYNASNALTHRQQNTYNDQGKLIEEIKTGGSGNVVHTVDIQYNNTGNILEETRKRGGDKLDYKKVYQYDSGQRPVREETENLDGTKFVSHEYTYNNLGDLILEKWKKNSRAQDFSTKKYTYASNGTYTDIDCFFASYNLNTLYKYTYDYY